MKNIIFLGIALFLNPVYAADVVDEILELSGVQTDFETQYSGLSNTIFRDEARANSNQIEVRELRNNVIEMQEKLFEEKLSWAAVRKEVRKIYLQIYSEEELLAYVEFLRKEAGRSFLGKNSQLIKTFRKMMEQRGAEYVEKKELLIKEYRNQIKQYENN